MEQAEEFTLAEYKRFQFIYASTEVGIYITLIVYVLYQYYWKRYSKLAQNQSYFLVMLALIISGSVCFILSGLLQINLWQGVSIAGIDPSTHQMHFNYSRSLDMWTIVLESLAIFLVFVVHELFIVKYWVVSMKLKEAFSFQRDPNFEIKVKIAYWSGFILSFLVSLAFGLWFYFLNHNNKY